MTALALVPGRRGRDRSFRLGIIAGLLVPVALLLAFSLVPRGGGTTDPSVPAEVAEQRQALGAFEEALEPLVQQGAATVVYGMRPGINDIYDRRFDDDTLVSMAQGWIEASRQVRQDVAGIAAPDFLTETADLYRQAFDEYLATAQALLAAAAADEPERAELISQAAQHGTQADTLYETAKAQLQQHRQRLGLDPRGGTG